MPVYEYFCEDCGQEFDTLRSMKEADKPIACIHCQGFHTRRKLSRCFSRTNGSTGSNSATSSGCAGCSGSSCASCRN